MAKNAYDVSLAKHHPWPIRQAVSLAFHGLPHRDTFVATMVANQPEEKMKNEESCRDYLVNVSLPTLKRVYQIIEDIYTKANMLDLP